jgi:hypothetical protein
MTSVLSSLNRKCLLMNVHGISRAAAFVLSHDSRTLRIIAASAAVGADRPLSPTSSERISGLSAALTCWDEIAP